MFAFRIRTNPRHISWWARFGAGVNSNGVASPSSNVPIRDTAQPPLLQSICETSDPFVDGVEPLEEPLKTSPDEQGRKAPSSRLAYQARQTPSQSSENSTGTVVLDPSMEVVQHSRRLASGSQSSASVYSPLTDEGDDFVSSPVFTQGAALVRAASSIRRPAQARRMTAGTTGVKHMIKEIEERESAPSSPVASPQKSPRKKRVHHGLAPKANLVLANPD